MTELGLPTSRTTIVKIEKGGVRAENTSLQELLALAAALGVTPIQLLEPRGNESLAVTPKLVLQADQARLWIRGKRLLPGADPIAWFAQLPQEEQRSIVMSSLSPPMSPLLEALVSDETRAKMAEKADDIAWEITEGDRIRAEEQRKGKETNA